MTERNLEHARLAPSSAHIWVNCPGSVAMQEALPPEEETDDSREGTAAHWLLCQTLRKILVPADAVADNGVPINDEMREAIKPIVEDILDTLKNLRDGDYWQNEVRLTAHNFIHPDNDGTPDAYALFRSRKTAHIWDFKYGHRFVDVYACWQLVNYAAALIDSEGIDDWRDWVFTFTIGQPRCYVRDELGGGVREWITTGAALEPLFNEIRTAAREAVLPATQCQTGEHCLDCKAAWDCEANHRMSGTVLDLAHRQQGLGLTNESIGRELALLESGLRRLEARRKILEVRAMAAFDTGGNVPGYETQFGESRLVWIKEKIPEAAQIVTMFGIDIAPGVPLPTPSQCIKQGIDETVIKPYIIKPNGAKKLVRVAKNAPAKRLGRR